jgi:fluoride exporter
VITLWLTLAGGAGAMTRYVADTKMQRLRPTNLPVGTLVINVTGSLILGVIAGLVIAHGASRQLETIVGTGFCGGYTTFSAASVETIRLAEQRRWAACIGFAGVSLVLALLAAGLGLAVTGA